MSFEFSDWEYRNKAWQSSSDQVEKDNDLRSMPSIIKKHKYIYSLSQNTCNNIKRTGGS